MKIDYTRNFVKFCGSKKEAVRIAEKVAKLDGDRLDHWTVERAGRYIIGAWGEQKNFTWNYLASQKEIFVCFTDGRPEPNIEPKKTYFIIWIEGFNHKTGDKIKHFDKDGRIVYTHKMREAMRIKKEDIERMKAKLRRLQMADWTIDSPNTFVETHYAPKGTLYQFMRF